MSKTTFSILSRPDSYKSFILLLVFSFSLPVFLYAAEPTLKDVMENDAAFEGQSPDGDKQANETQPEKTLPAGPIDDLDRGVPRSSILGFAQVTEKGDFERAAEYLDLRHLPYGMNLEDGPELARQLRIVLDRALWIDPELLSALINRRSSCEEDELKTLGRIFYRLSIGM